MTTQTIPSNGVSETGFLSWKSATRAQDVEVADFVSLGRDPDNQVVLDDEFASSRHARIERKNGVFMLRDLRSR